MALRIDGRAALDLHELSGLAARGRGGGRELLAVGDGCHDLLAVPLARGVVSGAGARHDLRPVAPGGDASGLEAVACDGAGRVLLLQEGQSRVLVVAPGLDRLERAVDLVVERRQAGFGEAWAEEANARGEGLLPMARGHLLVAKQREPVALIEFGPPGDAPLGVGPGTLLGPDDDLALPGGGRGGRLRYDVLAWWPLSPRSARRLESANDLARDEGGRLVVLSARSRVGRLAPLDPAGGEATVAEDWRVPQLGGGGRSRPEALCLVPGAALVGYDARGAGDNLAVLEPLGGAEAEGRGA